MSLNLLNLKEARYIQILDPTANSTMLPRLLTFFAYVFSIRQQVPRQADRMFLDVEGIPKASVSCCRVQLPTSCRTKVRIDRTMAHKSLSCKL